MTDWPSIARDVAEAELGPPNHKLSNGREWRWGKKGSLKLDLARGTFADFEDGWHGGVIDFAIRRGHASTRGDAFRWLEQHGHKPESLQSTPRRARRGRAAPASAPMPVADDTRRLAEAQAIWQASEPWPRHYTADHPGWLWATEGAKAGAWDMDLAAPRALRWLASEGWPGWKWLRGEGSVGAVVLPLTRLTVWERGAVPGDADVRAVLLVAVRSNGGRPWGSRGGDKRTRGLLSGSVSVLGHLARADRLLLVEGVADGLTALRTQPGRPAVLVPGKTVCEQWRSNGVIETAKRMGLAVECRPDGDSAGVKAQQAFEAAASFAGCRVIEGGPVTGDPYEAWHSMPTATGWLEQQAPTADCDPEQGREKGLN